MVKKVHMLDGYNGEVVYDTLEEICNFLQNYDLKASCRKLEKLGGPRRDHRGPLRDQGRPCRRGHQAQAGKRLPSALRPHRVRAHAGAD